MTQRIQPNFGAEIIFPHDGLPIAKNPLLKSTADIRLLPSPKPEDGPRMLDRLRAVDYMRSQVGGTVPVMGWVEGALAQAADLRGINALMMDVYDNPVWVQGLLEHCVNVEIAFAKAQATDYRF